MERLKNFWKFGKTKDSKTRLIYTEAKLSFAPHAILQAHHDAEKLGNRTSNYVTIQKGSGKTRNKKSFFLCLNLFKFFKVGLNLGNQKIDAESYWSQEYYRTF